MCLGSRVGVYQDADETWEDPGGKRETPQQPGGGWVSHILVLYKMLMMAYCFG